MSQSTGCIAVSLLSLSCGSGETRDRQPPPITTPITAQTMDAVPADATAAWRWESTKGTPSSKHPGGGVGLVSASGINILHRLSIDVHLSVDDGRTWSLAPESLRDFDAAAALGDGKVVAVAHNRLMTTADGGATWVESECKGLGRIVRSIFLAPDGAWYFGTWFGVFRSADRGVTCRSLNEGIVVHPDFGAPASAFAVEADGTIVAAINNAPGLFRLAPGTSRWIPWATGLDGREFDSIIVAPSGDVLIGGLDGISRSPGKGARFSIVLGVPNGTLVPITRNVMLAYGTGAHAGVHVSTDAGATWESDTHAGLPEARIQALAVTPRGHGVAFVDGHGVFRTSAPIGSELR